MANSSIRSGHSVRAITEEDLMKNLCTSVLVLLLSAGVAACGESVTGPDYVPDPGGYVPDPGGYVPDPGGYVPDPGGYVPDPGGYVPDPGS